MNKIRNHPKTVLVDMDGVLADFNGKLHGIMATEHPGVLLPKPQTEFYLDDEVHPAHRPAVREVISRPGYFLDLLPIDGAIDGWGRLLGLGYQPQICSAPLRKNETWQQDKLAWLEEYFVPRFGMGVVDLAIKWLHPGVALIDDRPDPNHRNTAGILPAWQHIVYDQPYNRLSKAPHRMLNWEDPLLPAILNQIEKESQYDGKIY